MHKPLIQIESNRTAEVTNIRPWESVPMLSAAEIQPPKQKLEMCFHDALHTWEKAVSLQCHGDQPTPPRIFPYKWHWCLTQDLNSTVSLERTLPQKESHFIVLDIKIKGDDSIIGSSYHQINTTETIISTLKQVIDNSKASQLLGSSWIPMCITIYNQILHQEY